MNNKKIRLALETNDVFSLFEFPMQFSGIYFIANKQNNRIYIGSAVRLDKRLQQHYWSLTNNRHNNSFLQNDFNKYGKENFVCGLLVQADKKDLLNLEQIYLDLHFDYRNTCYNLCPTAGNRLGTKQSEDAKRKMSLAWSEERKQKLVEQTKSKDWSGNNKGRKLSEDHKKILSSFRKGKLLTKDIKDKISLSLKEGYSTGRIKKQYKTKEQKTKDRLSQKTRIKITCIQTITNEKIVCESIREASEVTTVVRHHIRYMLKNPFKKNELYRTSKNWRFENDN